MSLVLRYPFNEFVTEDVSSNYQSTAGSGVKIVDDNSFGKVAQFDGSTEAYIEGPTFPDLMSRTVSYWVWTDSTETMFVHSIGTWSRSDGTGSYIANSNLLLAFNNKSNRTSMPMGTWTHICQTYDGQNFTQYLNGKLKVISLYMNFTTSDDPFYVGKSQRYNTKYNFNGNMSDFRIYDKKISNVEIQELYSLGPNGVHTVIPGTITLVSVGSTSVSVIVEGDPTVDYSVVVADQQQEDGVKSGDTVIFHDLAPNSEIKIELYST